MSTDKEFTLDDEMLAALSEAADDPLSVVSALSLSSIEIQTFLEQEEVTSEERKRLNMLLRAAQSQEETISNVVRVSPRAAYSRPKSYTGGPTEQPAVALAIQAENVEVPPNIRMIVDERLRIHDFSIAQTGISTSDLTAHLDRPAVEMFSVAARGRLAESFEDAFSGRGSETRALMKIGDDTVDYALHIYPGGRFVHVDAAPISATGQKKDGDARGPTSASRLEYIGMVATRISHDFKNLLAAILVNAEFLRHEDKADRGTTKEVAEEILVATERARELIEQILDYAGSKAEPRASVDFSDIAREMGRLLEVSTPPTIVLRYDLDDEAPAVRGQPLRLRQLLLNFIVNASEAIGEQIGAIMISTRAVEADDNLLGQTRTQRIPPAGRYVSLDIEDTGPGMDAETAEHIFDPFFTTKEEGHGLGLSACLTTVEEHGGALLLDSEPGQGSRFRVLLPMADEEAEEIPVPHETIEYNYSGRTILIVDDDDLVRAVAQRSLRARGFEVLVARDGLQAIDLFNEHHHRIDTVLLDMGMPYMTGDDVFEELRRIDPTIPIIFVSAQSEGELYRYSAVSHADGVVFKPFREARLLSAISLTLDRDVGRSDRVH